MSTGRATPCPVSPCSVDPEVISTRAQSWRAIGAHHKISRVIIYSHDVLLFLFGTSLCSMFSSNYCFQTCIQVSQETGQVVWYSHLLKNFPQFIVIHRVKGFVIVNRFP